MKEVQVRLKLTSESGRNLYKYVRSTGLQDYMKEVEYHLTLYYTEDLSFVERFKLDSDDVYTAYVIGYGFALDEDPTELIIKVFCPELIERHEEIKEMDPGSEDYAFIPHVAVKYSPEKTDAKYIKESLPLGMKLEFEREYIEFKE